MAAPPPTVLKSPDCADLQAAAQRVLASASFSRSQRLREFLSFVVKCVVDNNPDEINEYSLGIQVFGKSPNFRPNEDNIVRVTARHLRIKLAEYYAAEGAADPVRIEIPKGSYLPVCVPNLVFQPAAELPALPSLPAKPRPYLAITALLGWVLAALLWFHPFPPQPAESFLLSPILTDSSRPVTIVLDDPILSKVWRPLGRVMSLDEIVAHKYLDPASYPANEGATFRELLNENYFVHYSSVQNMLRIGDVARSHGVTVSIASSRGLEAKEMERGNFIFLGGIGSNPWVGEIQKHLNFDHLLDPHEGIRKFVNRAPRPGEPAVFESTLNSDSNRIYYTRVAVLKNPFGIGKIALLGGTSREATEAAGRLREENGRARGQKPTDKPGHHRTSHSVSVSRTVRRTS